MELATSEENHNNKYWLGAGVVWVTPATARELCKDLSLYGCYCVNQNGERVDPQEVEI